MLLNIKNRIILFFILALALSSCAKQETQNINNIVTTQDIEKKIEKVEVVETPEIPKLTEDDVIKQKVATMTLEEKIGQMFIVVPEVFSTNSPVTSIKQLDIDKMKKYNIGGFVFFSNNIVNPTQITELNYELSNVFDETKMFLSVDEEGGQVARVSNNVNFPDKSIENMSEVSDTDRAYEIGDTIGKYLKNYGFNTNFAPVCDVFVNANNTVVKKRSFSSDPKVVIDMTTNVLNGLENSNIISGAKHFPGHGGTTLDTHDGFAISNSTFEDMNNIELLPFENMINNSIDMIMVSHVIYPNLSSNEVPATLNYDIVTTLLKDELGYSGVVITDGMNMGAIVNNYSVEESTVMAVKSGIDIVLMPSDFYKAYDALINAVKNGYITEEQIDNSVIKILKLKNDM